MEVSLLLVILWKKIPVFPACRFVQTGGVEARWGCPKFKENGCSATFSTRIAISEEALEMEPFSCPSDHHCRGCKRYRRYYFIIINWLFQCCDISTKWSQLGQMKVEALEIIMLCIIMLWKYVLACSYVCLTRLCGRM